LRHDHAGPGRRAIGPWEQPSKFPPNVLTCPAAVMELVDDALELLIISTQFWCHRLWALHDGLREVGVSVRAMAGCGDARARRSPFGPRSETPASARRMQTCGS
jgi:hypothetical protein